ncbi:MAG TPA: hypothetical protein VNR87_12470 [Flavisolibacter sp.]|nr:hypothetical protein [Flavisolibacter sp.]
MQLIMYINGIPIDSVRVDVTHPAPGYVNLLKAGLEEKNEEIIDLTNQEPEFFIDTVPSRMNDPRKETLRH